MGITDTNRRHEELQCTEVAGEISHSCIIVSWPSLCLFMDRNLSSKSTWLLGNSQFVFLTTWLFLLLHYVPTMPKTWTIMLHLPLCLQFCWIWKGATWQWAENVAKTNLQSTHILCLQRHQPSIVIVWAHFIQCTSKITNLGGHNCFSSAYFR